MKNPAIAFAETDQQWSALVRYRRDHCPDLQIIPITPHVDYLAELDGSPYRTIESFVTPEELHRQGDQNIQTVEALADDFDRIYHVLAKHFPRYEWISLRAFFHQIKIAFDRASRRVIPILKVFDEIKPQWVVCMEVPAQTGSGIDPLDMPPTSLTSRLVPFLALKLGNCTIVHLDKHGRPCELQGMDRPEQPEAEDCLHSTIWWRARIATEGLFRSLFASNLKSGPEAPPQPTLIHNIFSDYGTKFVDYWREQGFGEAKTFGEVFQSRPAVESLRHYARWIGSELWRSLKDDPLLRRHFVISDFDCFNALAPLFQHITRTELPDLLLFAQAAQLATQPLKRAVIITGGMVGQNYVIAKAAEASGIPVVTTHFGGYMGYCDLPLHERYDRGGADYFICGGVGAAAAYSQPSPLSFWRPETKLARPAAIGLPWLDELVYRYRGNGTVPKGQGLNNSPQEGTDSQKQPRHFTVMYVMSAMVGDLAYLGYVFVPDIALWRFQRRVIEVFEKYPSVTLILKPPLRGRYPQVPNPVFEWLASRKTANVAVLEEDVRFSEVMDKADAFILDDPATPLLESLATQKPLLILADKRFFRLESRPASLLRKRARIAESEGEFLDMLESCLSSDSWLSPNLENDEFLEAYGVHTNDGRSTERLAGFLCQVAMGRNYTVDELLKGPV